MQPISRKAAIHPARRLAFRILTAVMLVQAAVFITAGAGYLFWYEGNLDSEVSAHVLAPGQLIQQGQMPHSTISERDRMQSIVGSGLADALLVGADGNVFYALDPTDLGKQVSTIPGVQPAWFRSAGNKPSLTRQVENGHSYVISVTPLMTLDNIAPFLYVYVKLDTTFVDGERSRMRAATIAAVLFAIIATTVVIYAVFELVLFRRLRGAVRMLGDATTGDAGQDAPASDEMGLVEIGLQKIAADRERQRSLRAEAESALVEVTAKHEVEARRARSLIDAVPDGLITIGPDLAILTCNDTAARWLGGAAREMIGRPITSLLRPVEPPVEVPTEPWPEIGTHRAVCTGYGDQAGGEEIEIVVSDSDAAEGHRAIFLRQPVNEHVRHELELLSDSIGDALRLTPGQWQSIGERLGMLRAYLGGLEAERRIVSKALDAVPLAVSVVDGNGTVRFANRAAEQLLDKKDGLLILQGRLAATRGTDNTELRQRIKDVASSDGSDPHWAAMRIERDSGTAWFISVAPLGQVAQSATADMVIVMISDPHMPTKPSTSMLRQLHDLTYAEAEILGRLTMGARLTEIAEELGISVETVRTHLKAIFTKTGTSRQAELVRHAVLSGVMLQVTHTQAEGPRHSGKALLGGPPNDRQRRGRARS